MSEVLRATIENILRDFPDPYLKKDWLVLEGIKNIQIDGASVLIEVELGYPCNGLHQALKDKLCQQLKAATGVERVTVNITTKVPAGDAKLQNIASLQGVKHVIPVASGKGGVGKSTTAVNLALALVAEGAKVGILDADIYGPSQHIVLGIDESRRPQVVDEKFFLPLEAHGLKAISMGNLVAENTPMVWRGPMASGALQQLIKQTVWGELDYLIIDMPPGTGDIQLTLSQSVPISGAVIVTTPQDIALHDARKGIEMFRAVDVPVLGIVENMSLHICSQCGHSEPIFGEGGGKRIAQSYQTELLGALPLDISIRENADIGKPSVVADPNSPIAEIYKEIARRVGARVWERAHANTVSMPEIVISNN